MADVQVTCINKVPRQDPHGGITYLGNSAGKWTCQQVVDRIQSETNTYFTMSAAGKRVDIGVVNGPTGKCARTYAAGIWTDSLLTLPECP